MANTRLVTSTKEHANSANLGLHLEPPVEEGSSDVLRKLVDRWEDIWIDSSDKSSCGMVNYISAFDIARDTPR